MAQQPGTTRRRPWWVGRLSSSGSALGQGVGPLVSGIAIWLNINRHLSERWLSLAFLVLLRSGLLAASPAQ